SELSKGTNLLHDRRLEDAAPVDTIGLNRSPAAIDRPGCLRRSRSRSRRKVERAESNGNREARKPRVSHVHFRFTRTTERSSHRTSKCYWLGALGDAGVQAG